MGPIGWQSSSAGNSARAVAQRLWMNRTSPVMTIEHLKFVNSGSDDEDDRESHSTNTGDSSGASMDQGSISSSQSQSGSARSSPIASPAFPPGACDQSLDLGFDSLSTCSHVEDSRGTCSSSGSSPSRLPHVVTLGEDAVKKDTLLRKTRGENRNDLQRLAKILGEGAGYDYRLIRAAFQAVDSNDDGWVSDAAFEAVFNRFGVAPDVALQVTARLQRNSEGCVNYMNFMALCGPVLQKGLRAQPRFQAPSPAVRPEEQRHGPHGWRMWQRIPAVTGQAWHLN